MSLRRIFVGLVFLVAGLGLVTFFNQGKPKPFPFSQPLEKLPGYQAPGEGVTLYPTGGPFGVDTIETIATGEDGTLFVGTFGGGLFRTVDGGRHWDPVNKGLRDKFIGSLIYLGDGTVFTGTIRGGLYKSEDNGESWAPANQGLEDEEVGTMALLENGAILAGTGQGIFISREGGLRWESFSEGLPPVRVQSIVVNKQNTLFIGTQGEGVYKRKAGGEAWELLTRGFSFRGLEERITRALVLGPDEVLYAGTMSAGIFRSEDEGAHWQSASFGLPNLSIRTLAADGKGILYAGTGEGIYYSEDGGGNWLPLLEGMDDTQIHTFSANPSGELFSGSSGGLYRGKVGMAWETMHDQLLISPALSLDYGQEILTVGTYGKGTYINERDNWMSDNLGLINLSIRALARGRIFLYAMTDDGVYRRQIGRHQWNPVAQALPGEVLSIGVDASDRVYIGSSAGLFSSSDHGGHWQKEAAVGDEPFVALAFKEKHLFAASAHEIWHKTLEGPWERTILKEGDPFQMMLWRPGKGLLAVTGEKIWERDSGGVWREFPTALPEKTSIHSLAVDPHDSNLLYLGTGQGLFWSPDNGASWHRAKLYRGDFFEGRINQVLPTNGMAIWLATEKNGVVLGISKPAERSWLQRQTDRWKERADQ